MNTLSSKLTTLVAALTMNGILLVGIAYLFGTQLHQLPAAAAQAHLESSRLVLV